MILDTSAIVALLLRETGFERIARALDDAQTVAIGSPTLVETGLVLEARLLDRAAGLLMGFLRAYDVVELPFGAIHWPVAVDAFRRYGKGRHPARLNLGDCFTYATARVMNQPLLCVGDDFPRTDLELA